MLVHEIGDLTPVPLFAVLDNFEPSGHCVHSCNNPDWMIGKQPGKENFQLGELGAVLVQASAAGNKGAGGMRRHQELDGAGWKGRRLELVAAERT